jgi:hypothetical protein
MTSIFDRLQQQLDIRKREEGISALEIRDLPPNLRKIMRLMLREIVMKYNSLVAAVDAMPATDRLSHAELDVALNTLVEQNWLVRYGEAEFTSYRVNLRRKAGSQLQQDIWSTLGSRIHMEPPSTGPGALPENGAPQAGPAGEPDPRRNNFNNA